MQRRTRPIHTGETNNFVVFILTFVDRWFLSLVPVVCLPHNYLLGTDMLMVQVEVRSTNVYERVVVLKGKTHTPNGGTLVPHIYIRYCGQLAI